MSEQLAIKDITITDFRNLMYKRFNQPVLFWTLIAMIFSYFYNLPVITYAAVGNNELRLYDLAGLVLLYYYFNHFDLTYLFIKSQPFFRSLHLFLVYCMFTLMFTLLGSIIADKYLYFFSGILYFYHFVVFFLTAVYLSVLFRNPAYLKKFVVFSLVVASLAFLIVILQNLGIVPFLWNDGYKKSYQSFLSGTFGPNKIVLGISALLIFILSIGLVNQKRVLINKYLLYLTVGVTLIALIMSGSRTAYLGGVVFLLYYSVKQPLSLINSSIAAGCFFVILILIQPEIIDKTFEVYEGRVEKKIKDKDDIKEGNVGNLYEDLGAGRDRLLVRYLYLIADEYYVIPFGKGFNNRVATGSSAHNMYLSLIYEVGLVGLILYVRWLVLYLFVRMRPFQNMETALHGLILSMLVTLFFGEHLYVYRALFGLVGLFLFVVTVLTAPLFLVYDNSKENRHDKQINKQIDNEKNI